jgi:hypothetical protein
MKIKPGSRLSSKFSLLSVLTFHTLGSQNNRMLYDRLIYECRPLPHHKDTNFIVCLGLTTTDSDPDGSVERDQKEFCCLPVLCGRAYTTESWTLTSWSQWTWTCPLRHLGCSWLRGHLETYEIPKSHWFKTAKDISRTNSNGPTVSWIMNAWSSQLPVCQLLCKPGTVLKQGFDQSASISMKSRPRLRQTYHFSRSIRTDIPTIRWICRKKHSSVLPPLYRNWICW